MLDNRSEEDGWTDRLAGSGQRHRLVSCRGMDSIPAIINRGVDSVRGPYTHYLILSQDAEAIDPGWLEHMLGYGQRSDVGVVGALLIDHSERVQHAGLVIGLNGLIDSVYKDRSYRGWLSGREPGQDGSLLSSRDVSAVSSSCLLTKADLFHPLGGMDEQLAVALFDVDYCLRVHPGIQDHPGSLTRFSSIPNSRRTMRTWPVGEPRTCAGFATATVS